MMVERRAAIRQLMREVLILRMSALVSTERLIIVIPSGDTWHAVYRFDGAGFACWDFFHASRDPQAYDTVVSDRLLRTNEVMEHIRRMRG